VSRLGRFRESLQFTPQTYHSGLITEATVVQSARKPSGPCHSQLSSRYRCIVIRHWSRDQLVPVQILTGNVAPKHREERH
jgi:hypothetical protein